MSRVHAKAEPNYERTRLTLADCSRLDELAGLANLMDELQAFYKEIQNADAEVNASRTRLHIERLLGQTLKSAAANAERAQSRDATAVLTLSVLGIPRDRVSRAMQLAALPDSHTTQEAPAINPASEVEWLEENGYARPWSFEEFMSEG